MRIPDRDHRTIKAEFDVWLAREMLFNHPPRQDVRKYPKFYKAKKVKYTKQILRYLDRMEAKEFEDHRCRAVAIYLDGMVRYVWRSDLLSQKEYDDVQKKQRHGLGILRQKLGRNVGKKSDS